MKVTLIKVMTRGIEIPDQTLGEAMNYIKEHYTDYPFDEGTPYSIETSFDDMPNVNNVVLEIGVEE